MRPERDPWGNKEIQGNRERSLGGQRHGETCKDGRNADDRDKDIGVTKMQMKRDMGKWGERTEKWRGRKTKMKVAQRRD